VRRGKDDYSNDAWFRTGKVGKDDRFGLEDSDPGLAQINLVHVAPAPVLARLERLHDGVLALMEVLGGVLVLGRITAADVAAGETFSEMDPAIAHLQAFLAALPAGSYLTDFF